MTLLINDWSQLIARSQTPVNPPSITSLATMAVETSNQQTWKQYKVETTNYVGKNKRHLGGPQQHLTHYSPSLRDHESFSYAHN